MASLFRLSSFFFLLSLGGCSLLPAPLYEGNVGEYHPHRVQHSGETLGLIAKWYTGDVRNWREIARHNQAVNVHNIQIGQKIFIPKELLIRTTAFPRGALHEAPNSHIQVAAPKAQFIRSENSGDYQYPTEP